MSGVNLLVLIDQLEVLIERAPEVPLIGKLLIDGDEFFELIDVIRAAIPTEIKRAEAVSSEKEKMIADGQLQAERLIARAEEYAGKLVRNSEIYRQAQEESKMVLQKSENRAKEIEEGARNYALKIFENLHEALSKTLAVVEKSKEELARED